MKTLKTFLALGALALTITAIFIGPVATGKAIATATAMVGGK